MPRLTAVIALALAALAGPAPAGEDAMTDRAALIGSWVITFTDESAIPAGAEATMQIAADGTVSGVSACNQYTTRLAPEGLGLVFDGAVAGTRMACDMPRMQAEYAILRALERADAFEAGAEGITFLSAGAPVLRLAPSP